MLFNCFKFDNPVQYTVFNSIGTVNTKFTKYTTYYRKFMLTKNSVINEYVLKDYNFLKTK